MNDKTPEQPEEESLTLFDRLRAYLFAGILVTAPIFITLYLTWVFLLWVDSKVTPLLPAQYNPSSYLPFSMPGIGLVVALAFFIAVGWLARNFLGRIIIGVAENVVHRVPVINSLYKGLKQAFETVMTTQSQAFRDVVMFEFPRKGMWALGFVTGVTKGEVQRLTEDEVVNVFFPTTPNPTSGFLIFVPRQDLRYMEMSVEEAIKMIISGGIITPPDPHPLPSPAKERSGNAPPP